MPKDKNKKLTEEDQTKIQSMLDELTSNNEVTEEERHIMEELLQNLILRKKESKFKRFIKLIKALGIKLVILYIISLILCGFFISGIVLPDKLQIFIVALIISFGLTIFEALPMLLKNKGSKSYLLLFGVIIINVCLLNNIFPVFKYAYYWAFFLIALEFCYAVFISYIFKKRFAL